VAARFKAWFCGSLHAGSVGSNPIGGMDVMSVVSAVCFKVEVFATS